MICTSGEAGWLYACRLCKISLNPKDKLIRESQQYYRNKILYLIPVFWELSSFRSIYTQDCDQKPKEVDFSPIAPKPGLTYQPMCFGRKRIWRGNVDSQEINIDRVILPHAVKYNHEGHFPIHCDSHIVFPLHGHQQPSRSMNTKWNQCPSLCRDTLLVLHATVSKQLCILMGN